MIACIIASFRQKATVTLQVRSRHCHACSPLPRATKNGTSMQRGPDCHSGLRTTADLSASPRSPVARLRQTGSRRHTIFIHNGAPQALVGCHENSMAGCNVMQLAHIPGIAAFFIHNGAPQALVGCLEAQLLKPYSPASTFVSEGFMRTFF